MTVEPVISAFILGQKHIKVWVEDSFGDQLKILIFDPTLIGPFFSNETDFERAFKILFDFPQLFHRVVKNIVSVDIEIQKNEPIHRKLMIKIDFSNNIVEAIFHLLTDVLFLLVDRFDLNYLELVLRVQQKGESDEVELRSFIQVAFELLNRVDILSDHFVVEELEGHSVKIVVREVKVLQH